MDNPLPLFREWYGMAQRHSQVADASVMSLATSSREGRPSVRMVLLKGFDEQGFVFYTNLSSPKAKDLAENPQAELCFHWAPLSKQVRIHGGVEPVPLQEADAYFASRPRLSQLGAWVSHQSTVMPHALSLETAVASAAIRFGTGPVPRPSHWSGFRLKPTTIEFWIEKPFRHHDRFLYRKTADGWSKERLFP